MALCCCRIVEWWNGRVVELLNRPVAKWWKGIAVKLWSFRVVESSNGGMVEL